jgi:hypothetical protein
VKTRSLSTIPPEVLTDSPHHIAKLVELRRALAESAAEYMQAVQYKNDCKKQVDADQTKLNNYINDLTEEKMFDKKVEGEVKHAKTEPVELKPVWPFPLPEGMRGLTLEAIAEREEVKNFGKTLVSSLRDKGFKVAGDVEVFCGGDNKNAKLTDHASKGIEKFLAEIGQRQGTITLNALSDVKAKWVEPAAEASKKPEGWPFPVAAPFDQHTISQVTGKYPKAITTPAAAKLVEAGITRLEHLNEQLKGGDSGPLLSLIGPGPAKKLIEAVCKYIADAK